MNFLNCLIGDCFKYFFCSFGVVYLGQYRGEVVAVKQIQARIAYRESDQYNSDSVEKEIKVMTQLRSPHLVSFFGAAV